MTESHPARPAGEPVVDRVFRLLFSFRVPGEALTLSALSLRTGIPKPTTLRLMRKLQQWGAVERQQDGTYVLGLRLLEVATLAPRGHGLRALVMPHLEDLHIITGQHVLLAVREGTESVLVERLSAPGSGQVLYRVGGRLPLHATGVGRVLLAHAPVELQQQTLAGPLVLEPEHQRVSESELRKALAGIRKEGFATMRRDRPEPMVSVAAPLFGAGGEVVAAISVIVPAGGRPQGVLAAVLTTARAISRELGGFATSIVR